MRSLVEGACGGGASLAAVAPSTALARGPPPHSAGEDARFLLVHISR